MGDGFFGADDSLFDQAPYIGLVAGQRENFGIAGEIEAAVAYVGIIKIVANYCYGSAGCAHAVQFGMFFGVLFDALMRGAECCYQYRLDVTFTTICVNLFNGLNGQVAGFLSAFVAAHAVSNADQAALALKGLFAGGFPVGVGIFVIL